MKHIAIITSGLVGITNASFQLAHRLQTEGHRITYLCPKPIEALVKAQGLSYVQLPEINFKFSFLNTEALRQKKYSTFFKYIYHYTHLKQQYNAGITALQLLDYERILNTLNPDVALIDLEIHEAILPALKLNINTKLLSCFLFNQRQSNLPPLRSTIIPKQGFSGSRLGIEFEWLQLKLKIIGRMVMDNLRLEHSRRSVLKQYLKQERLTTVQCISRNFPSAFIYKNIDSLYMVMEALEFPYKKPSTVQYIGAMVAENRTKIEMPDAINAIINLKNSTKKKLIYCSLTTMAPTEDVTFLTKLIKAVANENNWLLLISFGGKTIPDTLTAVPKNVFLHRWVPQLPVLAHTDCSINHGGIHTINECIHFKVPMLVYSGQHYDQDGNAARLAYHKIGLRGDKTIDSIESINTKIHTVLHDTSLKKYMARLHKTYVNNSTTPLTPYL